MSADELVLFGREDEPCATVFYVFDPAIECVSWWGGAGGFGAAWEREAPHCPDDADEDAAYDACLVDVCEDCWHVRAILCLRKRRRLCVR